MKNSSDLYMIFCHQIIQNPFALITLLIFYLKQLTDGVGLESVPKLLGLKASFPLL